MLYAFIAVWVVLTVLFAVTISLHRKTKTELKKRVEELENKLAKQAREFANENIEIKDKIEVEATTAKESVEAVSKNITGRIKALEGQFYSKNSETERKVDELKNTATEQIERLTTQQKQTTGYLEKLSKTVKPVVDNYRAMIDDSANMNVFDEFPLHSL